MPAQSPVLERIPVLAMTPVEELYEMPDPPESEDEAILLLNVVQSAEARYPFVEPLACVIEIAFPERESGAENVSGNS